MGWYVGGGQQSSFNPNSSSWNFSTSYEYYRFFPDGKVLWGWTPPKNGTREEHSLYRFPQEETKLPVVDSALLMSR